MASGKRKPKRRKKRPDYSEPLSREALKRRGSYDRRDMKARER